MAKPGLKRDPLSQRASDVITLFSEALAEVRFPDVDLKSLEMTADELRALQLEVERIEVELEEARARVSAQADVLNVQAERALAYARIFATTDPRLAQRVANIGDDSVLGVPPAAGKKRGRSRKTPDDANLFAEVTGNDAEPMAALG